MTRSSGWALAAAAALGLVGCNVVSDATSDGGAGSGEVSPSCYVATDKKSCSCYAQNKDSSLSAADWTKVDACTEAKAGFGLTCYADVKVDGTTSECDCGRFVPSCKITGTGYRGCTCDPESDGTDAKCSGPSYAWCCARTDGTSCYCGNGNSGSACGNEEVNVTSCGKTDLKRAKDWRTSCDGLKYKR